MPRKVRLAILLRLGFVLCAVGTILFATAGRLDLPFFWGYLGVFAGFSTWIVVVVPDDVLALRFGPSDKTSRDNLPALRTAVLLTALSQWVIAGVDVGRLHRFDMVPNTVRLLGLVGLSGSLGIWYWAMRTNPFFSPEMRIQQERGHRVVDTGPYAWVRHPGYAAFALLGAGGPLALGSWAALVPHLAIVALFARRAAVEDRMLQAELVGYTDYAVRVRYRWIPGVW